MVFLLRLSSLFIQINADTVRFHKTHAVPKIHWHDFKDVNVVYKTSSIKCFFRRKFQNYIDIGLRQKSLRNLEEKKKIYIYIYEKENNGNR